MIYCKYIDEYTITLPPINKENIINYNLNVEQLLLDGYKILEEAEKPSGEYTLTYEDLPDKVREIITVPTPEEIARRERERLDHLTLTPADVERALYVEKEMDFEDLKVLITPALPQVDIKGLAIEFRAKDFYRGAVANGMRLFDVVGALLGYTPQDMDYLFEHKELPVKTEPIEETENEN